MPSTKVGALLDRYPQLEEVLIGLAPPFAKLRNPLLRKGVAKVASLRHASIAGGIPLGKLINNLRAAVGQNPLAPEEVTGEVSYLIDKPEWFEPANIVSTIDERAADPDKMPVASVLQAATRLHAGEIIELITTFIPAPGIDIMKTKGLLVWSVRDEAKLVRTYALKPSAPGPTSTE